MIKESLVNNSSSFPSLAKTKIMNEGDLLQSILLVEFSEALVKVRILWILSEYLHTLIFFQ